MTLNEEGYTILAPRPLKKKVACLTLDVEQDYGTLLEEPSYDGIEHIPDLVKFFKGRDIPLTCFVQGSLLETHPTQIKQLGALDVEFELHSFSHLGAKDADAKFEIENGKRAYRNFFGREPMGYRCPDGVISQEGYQILAANGFKFDSSIFPSLRPGAFSNLRTPVKPYLLSNTKIIEFPISVPSSIIRIPIALSYIKLLGKPYFYFLKTFALPELIVFGFHLHDLFEIDSSKNIPLEKLSFIYRWTYKRIYQGGGSGLRILDEFITMLEKRGYTFLKLVDVYEALSEEARV